MSSQRFLAVRYTILTVVAISFLTRFVLLIISWSSITDSLAYIPLIFLLGLFYDVVVALFFAIPVGLFCWIMPSKFFKKKWAIWPLSFIIFIIVFILLFTAGAEIIFWNEFSVRFNFIAVDYLIYTYEVIGNIRQSYNLPLIVASTVTGSLLISIPLLRKVQRAATDTMRFGQRTIYFCMVMVCAAAGYFFVNNSYKNNSQNNYVNELGGNGIYEFGAAFWHNELDYEQFYITQSMDENLRIVRGMLQQSNATYLTTNGTVDRKITADSISAATNLVLISVESLSADFMAHFGNTQNITPYLDSLIPKTLFFENFYATGTRTVRGLEALSLAIPPTPGQSIVRRPHNEGMFTIGNVLKAKGYDTKYIYGGNSFFDNMGYFFSHSGYKVIDERDISEKEIHHKTIWGVADEDEFTKALQEADDSYKQKKPFFNHIMTVSNHRPYTFPKGRIDLDPARKTMEGAVKYTDWAIHDFLVRALKKPWFANTVFVIVSDHCSSSAGKSDLPVTRYHIPCFIYAPGMITARTEDRFVSQMDLAPTLLGLMNMSYSSKFLGKDIFRSDSSYDRVFISNYQHMGYLKHDTLTILSPQKKIEFFKVDLSTGAAQKLTAIPRLQSEAVAWYQTASNFFHNEKYTY